MLSKKWPEDKAVDARNVARSSHLVRFWYSALDPSGIKYVSNESLNCTTGQYVTVELHAFKKDGSEVYAGMWPSSRQSQSLIPGSLMHGFKNYLCGN
jgi:hypothetical protein